MNNYCLFHWPNYKFQKLADVWVAHNIDYRKITLSENPLSAGNFGEVFKGKDMYVQRLLYQDGFYYDGFLIKTILWSWKTVLFSN